MLKDINCTRCDISLRRKHMVNGYGKVPCPIMFVGEAPGYHEDKYGIPFIGHAGVKLTELLKIGGFNRKDIFITNIIRCRPPQNREPTIKEISKCKIWLQYEIFMVKPKIIVSLGVVPLKVISNNLKLTVGKVAGKAMKLDNFILFPMYHPAYLLYGDEEVRQEKQAKTLLHLYNLVEIYKDIVDSTHQSQFKL